MPQISEAMPEVDRLLKGHTTVGSWSLAKICKHLTESLTLAIEGTPERAPWIVRKLIAPIVLRRLLKTGTIMANSPTLSTLIPPPDLDERSRPKPCAAVQCFDAHHGAFAEHPFFGRMDEATVRKLQCIHFAHHLSFVLPEPKDGALDHRSPSRGEDRHGSRNRRRCLSFPLSPWL